MLDPTKLMRKLADASAARHGEGQHIDGTWDRSAVDRIAALVRAEDALERQVTGSAQDAG
ncbi:MAG: hypothetical protein M9894_28910 [Planctomycetes bacterium]|nr:hypothetical protein [Planctomycetota bacterium]